jgi:lipoic acid synthetase
VNLPSGPAFAATNRLLADLELSTVCQGAKCPNMFECFGRGVATFMILGSACTRTCAFCNIDEIDPGDLAPPDPGEPWRIARAARTLGLSHVVVTSVTRDDLDDGGAAHFAAVCRALDEEASEMTREVLVPDFQGDARALEVVLDAGVDVLNHNVETAPGLYDRVRPQADYGRSLELLSTAKARGRAQVKSGLMVGLGETDEEVGDVLADLARAGCDIVTIGQYMRPSAAHPGVARYVEPGTFEAYAEWGRALGIPEVFSAPLVRSSYNAQRFVRPGAEP